MNCCSDPYKNTIFWKSMMRSFRWIEINCFNRFRFLAEVSTNLQKMHYFGQFKDHNSGSKKRKLYKWPHFVHLLFELCLGYSFLYSKIVKIHFHGVSFLVHSGLQNIWILEVKAVRLGFSPVRFKKHTLGKMKSQVFYFFYWVENKFQNVQGNLMI